MLATDSERGHVAASPASSSRATVSAAAATASEDAARLFPPHLGVAILDDVQLVRTSTLRFFVRELRADPTRSFTCGATMREALEFPERVRAANPDVVLLDQHLEYDEAAGGHLLGTDIARRLREAGFLGCIVLHSANALLLEQQHDADTIDGVLEKQALLKLRVASELAPAWRKARSRMKRAMRAAAAAAASTASAAAAATTTVPVTGVSSSSLDD